MDQKADFIGQRVMITNEESDHFGELGVVREVDETGDLHVHDDEGEFMGLYQLDEVHLVRKVTFPPIVIEIEGGIVAAVYWGDASVMFAVVDHDHQLLCDEYIFLNYTRPLFHVPSEMVTAIQTTVEEET